VSWVASLIGAMAAITIALRAAGPLVVGGRELGPRFMAVVSLVAPALLAALVVTQALADGSRWAVDESAAGVAMGGVVFWRSGALITSVLLAAAVTAGLRAL
jgi:branched-subunit amino acid transport protein